jgi:hypothetical protein
LIHGLGHSRGPTGVYAVSAIEFDVLWHELGFDRMPLVLKVPSLGRTWTERREIEDRVWSDLECRGLGTPGRLDLTLTAMLRLLHAPSQEVDGRLWFGYGVRLLAARGPDTAVLATKVGDRFTLREISPGGLCAEAVSHLPDVGPGPGRSVTLPSPDLDSAATDPDAFRAALISRGVAPRDATSLSRMTADAGSRGQFGVAGRDSWGRRSRPDEVIGFFDTPRGRYLQRRRDAGNRTLWSTITPTDNHRLGVVLEALLARAGTPGGY